MTIPTSAPFANASPSFSTLAEQLRDGPLQQLIELQIEANDLANRLADAPAARAEDLERLVQLSLSAMERFHSFTREFAAAVRELRDVHGHTH